MQSPEERIAELTARIITLEAAFKTGSSAPVNTGKPVEYPFLTKLGGDDLIAAQTLVAENATLRAKIAELEDELAQRDFRIKHMKQALDQYIQ